MANRNNFLFLGDIHEPFTHPRAIQFAKQLKKDFDVPHENCYSVGDLLDQYWLGRWDKSPDAKHTPIQEIEAARARLKEWRKVFPELRIAESNHDMRYLKKALEAEIPSVILKSLHEIYEIPEEWVFKDHFVICGPDIMVTHGEEFNDATVAAVKYGLNVVQGHHHSKFGVRWARSKMMEVWGAATGWLGDETQYCFEYGSKSKEKSINGSIVVVDGIPYAIPLK